MQWSRHHEDATRHCSHKSNEPQQSEIILTVDWKSKWIKIENATKRVLERIKIANNVGSEGEKEREAKRERKGKRKGVAVSR